MFDRWRQRRSLDGRCARAELVELHAAIVAQHPEGNIFKTRDQMAAEADLWRRMGEPELAAIFDQAAGR